MSEHVTTTLGDTVAFDRYGEGPALVFVAGAGPFRATDPITTPTARAAADRGLTTVVYDRLGRGESPAEGRIGLDREIAVLEALVDAHGGTAVLCGHSSGCAIALAAADRGVGVDGLVLWEAPLDQDAAGTRVWIGEVERRLDDGDLAGALTHYMKDMPPEWRAQALQDPDAVARVVSYRADGEALVWADHPPYADRLAAVRVPTLCLVGEQTFPGMREAADAVAAAIPGATSGTAPGAWHAWEPGPMADLLADFVLKEKVS